MQEGLREIDSAFYIARSRACEVVAGWTFGNTALVPSNWSSLLGIAEILFMPEEDYNQVGPSFALSNLGLCQKSLRSVPSVWTLVSSLHVPRVGFPKIHQQKRGLSFFPWVTSGKHFPLGAMSLSPLLGDDGIPFGTVQGEEGAAVAILQRPDDGHGPRGTEPAGISRARKMWLAEEAETERTNPGIQMPNCRVPRELGLYGSMSDWM